MEDLSAKMQYSKANSDLNAEGATEEGQIRISKQLYNGVMSWDANDLALLFVIKDTSSEELYIT